MTMIVPIRGERPWINRETGERIIEPTTCGTCDDKEVTR